MQFEGIRAVLRDRDHYVINSSKGIHEPTVLRFGWCSCRRDSSRSAFWPAMLSNISECLIEVQTVRGIGRQMFAHFRTLIKFVFRW